MKKRICLFILLLVLLLAVAAGFSSCFGLPFGTKYDLLVLDIDETMPAEKKATVTFAFNSSGGASITFYIMEWGDFDITKDLYKKPAFSSGNRLIVPAGQNRFLFNMSFLLYSGRTSTTYTIRDYELMYNFEAEGEYEVKGRCESLGFLKGYEFYLELYNVKSGTSQLLYERKLGTSADFSRI